MSIEVRDVTKYFGSFAALKQVSLEVPSGELVALLGPSGSGKTTLLRIIAGLEPSDGGSVLFHGEDATQRSIRERQVGFVFQHYALFRHMTVFDNVAFGLRVRPRAERPSKQQIETRVRELLKLVQLDWTAHRYPSQLSGGQRQRIALARALAIEPKVLLLDEPFGALDARVRQELRRWLRLLHEELHITGVLVTHDQEEALEVADRVVIMNDGRVEQSGPPSEVYEQPANPFVFSFLGNANLLQGRAEHGRLRFGAIEFVAPAQIVETESAVVGYVRPHDLELHQIPNGSSRAEAEVTRIQAAGPIARLVLSRRDTREKLEAELPRDRLGLLGLKAGDLVYVEPRKVRVFPVDGRPGMVLQVARTDAERYSDALAARSV